ncbi:inositol polyphosphate-5-phosphatase A isoform X2 [Lynx rufus]|uniref:inositol-polyphosphate 5-phosphatase n=1 Tax=Lynx canadensis TaxID=61383 RepID=A0A667HCM0_LYNCA|nr:inositol polyphosphate-5-phosphatase A isoform X2 [Lynx rufus]
MAGKAAAPGTAVLLVTANVGSLFDDPENLQKNWLREFYQVVHTHKPHFMALHCQEFGGKNYETSMSHVDKFVKELLSSDAMKEYNRARVYLDENFKSQEHFTALGSFYFLHESLKNIYQFDFKAKKYKKVTGKEIYSDTLESTPMLEKEKFPQDYFPECKWSRKGFVRTRWCVADCAFDLVNIHLFHDASNLVAWETSPSVYSGIRHKALGYVLDRIIDQRFEKVSYFVFGDFNFRLDSKSVVETLCTQATMQTVRAADTNEVVKLIFRESDNDRKVMLQLEKKVFHYFNQEVFRDNNGTALLEFDKELSVFKDRLYELDISFPPSRRARRRLSPTTTSGPTSAWETTSPCSWPSASRPGQVNLTPMCTSVVSCSDVWEAMAATAEGPSRDLPVARGASGSRVHEIRTPNSCIDKPARAPPARRPAPHFASASGPFRKSLTYLTVLSVRVTFSRNSGFL